ncbi:cryptochrome/photolyase family protein [Chthonobacter albigriseus]|uniref:cryptochrome/photolyase family protein n=1 Tax=Chthonobacter albigriseus TaxID=1683161 RepID=UPI0019D67FBD|nr:deoxyribodipyrimidine photo-lyase [Chthonobacter albigriseus]
MDGSSAAGAPAIVWFRDDLRLADNPALSAAAATGRPVIALYILDEGTGRRPLGAASRWWLHESLSALSADLRRQGVPLVLRKGAPEELLPRVVAECGAGAIVWNRRYGRAECQLDAGLKAGLSQAGLDVRSFNGHLLIEPWDLRNKSGDYFKVFTPFWRAASDTLGGLRSPLPVPVLRGGVHISSDDLDGWRLQPRHPDWATGLDDTWTPGEAGARARLERFLENGLETYAAQRDVPASGAVSMLSPHLRFGEISVVSVHSAVRGYAAAYGISDAPVDKFVAELGWREFSYYLAHHFEALATRNFQSRFDQFPWRESVQADLKAWQQGRTGYPIVDAGMRQLWQTGFIHNRVRMIVASFLIKHLLIDWRIGEAWFWDTLVDADPANNAASWQWVAGSGADAAPYFRVFNPISQGEKFDPDGAYVRRYVPELNGVPDEFVHRPWEMPRSETGNQTPTLLRTYPQPIVDHASARERALRAFETLKSVA